MQSPNDDGWRRTKVIVSSLCESEGARRTYIAAWPSLRARLVSLIRHDEVGLDSVRLYVRLPPVIRARARIYSHSCWSKTIKVQYVRRTYAYRLSSRPLASSACQLKVSAISLDAPLERAPFLNLARSQSYSTSARRGTFSLTSERWIRSQVSRSPSLSPGSPSRGAARSRNCEPSCSKLRDNARQRKRKRKGPRVVRNIE